MATRQYAAAKALLGELIEARPLDGDVRHLLGRACLGLDEMKMAIRHFEEAIALNPNDADSRFWIVAIRQSMGDVDGARSAYNAAARIRPPIERRASKAQPDFRLLAIYAPFGANTPTQYLFRDSTYDVDTLALFDASEPDLSSVGDVDVVINLISDADRGEPMLFAAASIAGRLDRPVINDACKILQTSRDAVAELLRDISGCRVPRILRVDPDTEVSAAALAAHLPFGFPVLARPAGTHGGVDLEKIENADALARVLAARPAADHYIIEYIDVASGDGYFRKYRFIFVAELTLPYHLAIGNDWKVHHIATDMANRPWMQQEEAAFLTDPGAIFGDSHYQALRTVRERIGLDYFGIDCGLDRDGNLVVFEVNASMLVHDDNAQFPYKDPFVRNIKSAFNAMLRNRAGRDPAGVTPGIS